MSQSCSESVIEEIRYGAEKELGRVLSLLDRAKNRIDEAGVDTFITIVMEAGGPSSSVCAGNITDVVGLEVSPDEHIPTLAEADSEGRDVGGDSAGWLKMEWREEFFLRGCNE